MSIESALALIESVKDARVLFAGDTIIDEYHYVTPLGKSPKEHLIPVEYRSEEVFRGGIEAAANHARSFCGSVDVWSAGPITRKVRMIDKTYLRKLFEVHYNGVHLPDIELRTDYDCIVVNDFGHGAISRPVMDAIYRSRKFLALDVQTNSANVGFNLVTRHPRADYIVIDEPEARLAAADRDGPIEDVIRKIAAGRCDRVAVTLGPQGAIGFERGRFCRHKAMSHDVRDTMGAGDAFFAVTAPMARTGSMEDLLLIGNAAGAMKCAVIGHRQSVTKDALIEFLKANA